MAKPATRTTSTIGEPPGLWPVPVVPERDETRSAEERLDLLRRSPLFDYPRAAALRKQILAIIDRECHGCWPNLIVAGPANNGRTTFANRFAAGLNESDEGSAWLMQMTPKPAHERFWMAILKLGRPRAMIEGRSSVAIEVMAHEAIRDAAERGLRIVIIDTCDSLLDMPAARRRLMLVCVRVASEIAGVPFLLIGSPVLAARMAADKERIGATEVLLLQSWRVDRDYLDLLRAWDAALPLLHRSGLAERELALHLFALSDGRLGALARIIQGAAVAAIERGDERITIGLLDDLGFEVPASFSGFWF